MKKASQVERLGMGASASSKGGIGHSVLNQMNTIVQVTISLKHGFRAYLHYSS